MRTDPDLNDLKKWLQRCQVPCWWFECPTQSACHPGMHLHTTWKNRQMGEMETVNFGKTFFGVWFYNILFGNYLL